MKKSKIIRPVNSLIFVSDPAGGEVPDWEYGKLILWTKSCISIACYPEQDGPTNVILGDINDVYPGLPPQYAGELLIPNRVVSVQTVTHEMIVQFDVGKDRVDVRIWLNHSRWPDEVRIGVGSL